MTNFFYFDEISKMRVLQPKNALLKGAKNHRVKKVIKSKNDFSKSCPKFCKLGDEFFLFWRNLKNEAATAEKPEILLTRDRNLALFTWKSKFRRKSGQVVVAISIVHNKSITRNSWFGGRSENVPKQPLGCNSTKYSMKDKSSDDFFVT